MTIAGDAYDFIVTGAGSGVRWLGGSATPAAGGCCCSTPAAAIDIPGSAFRSATPRPSPTRVNWMVESEPEKELNNRTLYQPRTLIVMARVCEGGAESRGRVKHFTCG